MANLLQRSTGQVERPRVKINADGCGMLCNSSKILLLFFGVRKMLSLFCVLFLFVVVVIDSIDVSPAMRRPIAIAERRPFETKQPLCEDIAGR